MEECKIKASELDSLHAISKGTEEGVKANEMDSLSSRLSTVESEIFDRSNKLNLLTAKWESVTSSLNKIEQKLKNPQTIKSIETPIDLSKPQSELEQHLIELKVCPSIRCHFRISFCQECRKISTDRYCN